MKKTMIVTGMTCGHCVKRVENVLQGIDGVETVVVNLAEKSVVVESNADLDDAVLTEAIDDAGYDVVSIQ